MNKQSVTSRVHQGLLIAFLLSGINGAFASPIAAPVTSQAFQPDGSVISLQQKGDGEVVWYETPEGFSIMQDARDWWVYAEANRNARALDGNGGLVPSILVVGRDDPSQAGIPAHLYDAGVSRSAQLGSHLRSVSGGNPVANFSGNVPTVVILGFYDDAKTADNCLSCGQSLPSEFQATVFGASGQSVSNFISTMSNNTTRLVPVEESHGTADDGIVGWLRLGANTPQGTSATTTSFKSNRIASDAIRAAMSYVDFTEYDVDDDGKVTSDELAILIVVAGYEGSYGRDASGFSLSIDKMSPRLWAQSRSFSSSFVPTQSKNGRTVSINTTSGGMTYSIIGERHGNHVASMGIIVHELGHSVFGLPDLYDVSGASNGVGVWSVMSYGSWGQALGDQHAGDTPVAMDAWCRVALGWVTPTTPTSGSVVSVTAGGGNAAGVLKFATASSNEYFLVENRQDSGYDRGLELLLFSTGFGGLAVWHIDDSIGTAGFNDDNASSDHRRVDLVAAEGDERLDNRSNYGQVTNLYFDGNRNQVSDSTSPDTLLYSGGASGITLQEISAPGASMTLRAIHGGVVESNATARTASGGGGGGGGAWNPALLVLLLPSVVRRVLKGIRP